MDDSHDPLSPKIDPDPVSAKPQMAIVSPAVSDGARGLARLIYTNNPLYAVSAALVLWGLRISFDTRGELLETGALMLGLAGYTLLLAATAWFLIRLGKVWDDVRTLLLLVVLMFLAISVTFDESLAANPLVGRRYFLGGLAFAIVLSELLLAGIRLRLPALFRVPYYLTLALFFLYPLALSPLVDDLDSRPLSWVLFGFSTVAGAVFLTLLPAVRKGPGYVLDNGSPWRWPLYPWVLFAVLALGVCGRAYFLCMSFYAAKGSDTIFGLYFLVPLLLAVNVLFMEVAIVARSTNLQRLALAMPVGLLVLATAGSSAASNDFGFQETLTATLGGSPLFLTLLGVTVFYAVAFLRRVPHAAEALTAALAALAVTAPDTVGPDTLVAPQALPILLLGLLQLGIGLRRYSSPHTLAATCCLVAAAVIQFRGTTFTAYGGMLPAHLLLAAMLLIAATFKDRFARFLQYAAAGVILLGALLSMVVSPQTLGNPPPLATDCYPALAIILALAYGYFLSNRAYYVTVVGTVVGWLILFGSQGYQQLRQTIVGLDQIAWGIAFFVLAMLLSLTKIGIFRGWVARWLGKNWPSV